MKQQLLRYYMPQAAPSKIKHAQEENIPKKLWGMQKYFLGWNCTHSRFQKTLFLVVVRMTRLR
jgi:hypothetical protein